METLTLRFTSGAVTYEFVVDAYQYPLQINNAFIAFTQQHGVKSGQIEVLHPRKGWGLMCVNGVYPMINNPLALNYETVAVAIAETLAMMETWPDDDEAKAKSSSSQPVLSKGHLKLIKS